MMTSCPELRQELECRVQVRTSRRVRGLAVELYSDSVILRGQTATYYIKQLAQQGVREILPDVRLENAIEVGG